MRDVVNLLGIPKALVLNEEQVLNFEHEINYTTMQHQLTSLINTSKDYLKTALQS